MSRHRIEELIRIMATLRDPQRGCPWDREQDFSSIAPYTIEEAYEVADAIARNDMDELRDELGDLLFQVVFHARMAEEAGAFDFTDVVDAIVEKMIRRHPHVFADAEVADAQEQTRAWEQLKAQERREKGGHRSLLDGVTLGLPALSRACKLQKRAARAGFEVAEQDELLETLRAAVAGGGDRVADAAVGDLLFACAALARRAGIDPEEALRRANYRFETRFRDLESRLAEQGREPEACSPQELAALWREGEGSGRQ